MSVVRIRNGQPASRNTRGVRGRYRVIASDGTILADNVSEQYAWAFARGFNSRVISATVVNSSGTRDALPRRFKKGARHA
jgi:hypothetical protein